MCKAQSDLIGSMCRFLKISMYYIFSTFDMSITLLVHITPGQARSQEVVLGGAKMFSGGQTSMGICMNFFAATGICGKDLLERMICLLHL